MTEKLKKQWQRLSLPVRAAVVLCLGMLAVLPVLAIDTDNDGMSDAFEIFYGLNENNPEDAAYNDDSDTLNNLAEYGALTDPFASDTDRDGFNDGGDSNPVSRAYIDLGNPFFTAGDVYEYAAPAWWLGAEKAGGDWVTNAPTSWHVDAAETNAASILIDIDNALLASDLVMKLALYDHTNASAYVDLLDTNADVIATNIVGNVLPGNDAAATVVLSVPLLTYTNASAIAVRRGEGEVTVYSALLYVDNDGDGLDADQEAQLGTSDNDTDSDDDGISDYDEVFTYNTNPAIADTDADGLNDGAEVNTHGTNPNAADSDSDGLTDAQEVNTYGTNPLNADTDGDGMDDGFEVANGFDAVGSSGNLVGYWNLDETEGAVAADNSASANDGIINGASHVGALINYGLQFDGSNDLVTVSNSTAYKPSLLTVSCTVKFDELFGNTVGGGSEGGRMVLLAQANAGSGYGYALYKTDANALAFEVGNSSATNGVLAKTCASFVQTGEWYTVTATYDGTNAALYVNGEAVQLQAYTVALEYDSSTGLLFGQDTGAGIDSYLKGTLDNVQVYDAALAAAEIAESDGDSDGDGISNYREFIAGTNPNNADTDGDGLSDFMELDIYGTNPNADEDADGDGASDAVEILAYGSNPHDADTDDDGFSDGWEILNGFDPITTTSGSLDVDGDGLDNSAEYANGTNPLDADTDGDGLTDGDEVNTYSTSPTNVDTDSDGLSDYMELNVYSTSPLIVDSNTNGIPDGTIETDLAGTNTSARAGGWAADGDLLYATTNVGARLEYEVVVTNPGMHALELNITNTVPGATTCEFRMQLLIDRVDVCWIDVERPYSAGATVFLQTPWLIAGTHTIRIAWFDDLAPTKNLGVRSVTLRSVDAPDTNANGRQDWMDAILATGVDTDGDGLSDLDEIDAVTRLSLSGPLDPMSSDTDGDILTDGDEINLFLTDPLNTDSDSDGINDATLVASFNGADASELELINASSNRGWWWYVEGDVLRSPGGGVFAYYSLNVTNSGMYLVAPQVRDSAGDMRDDFGFVMDLDVNGYAADRTVIYADYDVSRAEYLVSLYMQEGANTIGIKWVNGETWNTVERNVDIILEKVYVYSVDGPDSNANGVQDWEETELDSSGDVDGDGLTDSDEVLIYGSSPVLADTDGDGLTDAEEVSRGTDVNDVDSDNDGVSDGEEAEESLTDPLTAEFDGTVTTVDTVYGSETNNATGVWEVDGTEIVAKRTRGYVEYTLTAPTSDCYRIVVEATHDWLKKTCSPVSPIDNSDLQIYIDDQYLGRKNLVAPDGIYGEVRVFTPYIGPGDHTVRVFWENVHSRISLRIKELRLQSLGGPDSDSDGVKDWVEVSVGNLTGLDTSMFATNSSGQYASVVSPVCLEGPARYVDTMSCTVGTNVVAVNHGAGDRWYVDAALSESGATAINLSFLNDAVTVSTNIAWEPLNLLGADNMSIRKNDSLMLNAQPAAETNGSVVIDILLGTNIITNLTTTVDQPVTHLFDSVGSYTVTGTFSNETVTTNASITVEVIGGSFPTNPPSCLIGTERSWACPDMPNNLVLESDDTVDLSLTNGVMKLTMWKVNKEHYAVARISTNGPILASTELVALWGQGAVDGYMWVTERYEDSALWQNRLIFKNVPENVDIQIAVIVSGVTLDDSTTERWITNADLDDLGQYDVGLIVPNSINSAGCHTVKFYQDGVYLGEAYYGGILMPNE